MKRIATLKKTICCFAAEKRQLPGGKRGGGCGGVGASPYIIHTGTCMCHHPTPKGIIFAPFWSENRYRLCPF